MTPMRDVRVSPAVDAALAAAGYRPFAPGEDGALVAVALDGSDHRVEMHVLRADATTRARVAALRAVRHEHLARVLEVVDLSADELGVFTDHVVGTRLDVLGAAREPFTAGETATLAIPVAQALEALHAAGLQHGGVGARSIVVGPDGRPVLAGLGVALRHVPAARDESAADVLALLDVVLPVLEAGGGGTLAVALEELRHDANPRAGRVVDRCFRIAVPEPVRLPSATDDAPRHRQDVVTSLRGPGRRADPSGAPGSAGRAAGATRTHGASAGTARRSVARTLLLAGCGVAVVAGVTGAVLVGPWSATADEAHAATPSSSATTAATHERVRSDPRDAAVTLTQRRALLLGQGRSAPLHEVELPDSPAHVADTQLVAQLGDDRVRGLEVTVTEVEPLEGSNEDEARVRVTSATTAYERVAPDGTVRPGGAAATSTVVLVLRWTDQGWRVWDVTAA